MDLAPPLCSRTHHCHIKSATIRWRARWDSPSGLLRTILLRVEVGYPTITATLSPGRPRLPRLHQMETSPMTAMQSKKEQRRCWIFHHRAHYSGHTLFVHPFVASKPTHDQFLLQHFEFCCEGQVIKALICSLIMCLCSHLTDKAARWEDPAGRTGSASGEGSQGNGSGSNIPSLLSMATRSHMDITTPPLPQVRTNQEASSIQLRELR